MPYHDKVDQRDCVQIDSPQGHHPEHVDGYHGDRYDNNEGWEEVKSEKDKGDDEDRAQDDAETGCCVIDHGDVLLVEDIENTGKEKWERIKLKVRPKGPKVAKIAWYPLYPFGHEYKAILFPNGLCANLALAVHTSVMSERATIFITFWGRETWESGLSWSTWAQRQCRGKARQVVAVKSGIFKGHHGNGRGHRRQLPSMPLCNSRAALNRMNLFGLNIFSITSLYRDLPVRENVELWVRHVHHLGDVVCRLPSLYQSSCEVVRVPHHWVVTLEVRGFTENRESNYYPRTFSRQDFEIILV